MNRLSIRQRIISFVFIGCMIPFFIGVFFINKNITERFYMSNQSSTEELLLQVKSQVEYVLFDMLEERVNIIASDERVQSVTDGLRVYSDEQNWNDDKSIKEEERQVARFFEGLLDNTSNINFIFFGTEEGGYIEYPEFNPSGPYDPTGRPWYIRTIEEDNFVITDPYVTQVTKDYVIGVTQVVRKDNKVIGVIGMTMLLDKLTDMVESVTIGNSGYVIVMNENDTIIISPSKVDWRGKTASEAGISPLLDLSRSNAELQEVDINGTMSLVSLTKTKGGWKVISIMDKSELDEETRRISNIMNLSLVGALGIVFIVLYYIGGIITEPILKLAGYVKSLANFELNEENREALEVYKDRQDAIGTISSAMRVQYDNFSELSSQMSELDEDIQGINLDHNERHQLKVSPSNPFAKVVNSINQLLTMTFAFIEELRQSNEMIVKKNDMLTASEEELRAQVDEIESQKEYIHYLAYHDALTNLPNRRKFYDQLNKAIKNKGQGAIALIDLDNFKSLNDTIGHMFGDHVLEVVGERLNKLAEEGIFVSRFGGDEFMMMCERSTTTKNIRFFADQIVELFNETFEVDGRHLEITPSVGIALFPEDSEDVNELIMYADLAMYKAKDGGRNGYHYFSSELADHLLKKSEIENILKEAVENDGFKMVYQPIVDTYTGSIKTYEALLRLKRHNISPAVFIDIAEESDLINIIGRKVTEMVVKQQKTWQDQGMPIVPVSINFSPSQIHDSGYVAYLSGLLEESGLRPSFLEIEITEAIFIDNKDRALDYMNRIKDLGISLAIDDFGTGFSSLNYLTFLPVDKIKLDRSLNMKFLELDNIQVMDSLISLAHSLNLEVVAEGIEVEEQVRRLAVGRCDYIQGYYFSKPLEAHMIIDNIDHKYKIDFENEAE